MAGYKNNYSQLHYTDDVTITINMADASDSDSRTDGKSVVIPSMFERLWRVKGSSDEAFGLCLNALKGCLNAMQGCLNVLKCIILVSFLLFLYIKNVLYIATDFFAIYIFFKCETMFSIIQCYAHECSLDLVLTIYGPNSFFVVFRDITFFVYRLIGATLIGNFFYNPFLK